MVNEKGAINTHSRTLVSSGRWPGEGFLVGAETEEISNVTVKVGKDERLI